LLRVSVTFLREGVKNASELADTGEKRHFRLVEVEFIRRSSQNRAEFANGLPLRAKTSWFSPATCPSTELRRVPRKNLTGTQTRSEEGLARLDRN